MSRGSGNIMIMCNLIYSFGIISSSFLGVIAINILRSYDFVVQCAPVSNLSISISRLKRQKIETCWAFV